MADEREGDLAPEDAGARVQSRRACGKRIAIVAAGPIANLLLAVLLFAGTFMAGMPGPEAAPRARRCAGTPAAAAGIRAGDDVVARRRRTDRELAGPALAAAASCRAAATSALDVRTLDGARCDAHRAARRGLAPADWEGPFMQKLGLAADFGPPLIDEALAGKPGERAGLKRGDRIVAIDGMPVRSPMDVAPPPTRSPGCRGRVPHRARRRDARRAGRHRSDRSRAGARSASPACGSRSIPRSPRRLSTDGALRPAARRSAQGVRKTWELSVFTLKMLGPHRHRRRVAQEHQRPDHARRLRRPVGAGRRARVRRLSRAHQHQPRRAQPAARAVIGRRAFAVLFRRTCARPAAYPIAPSRSASASAWPSSPC